MPKRSACWVYAEERLVTGDKTPDEPWQSRMQLTPLHDDLSTTGRSKGHLTSHYTCSARNGCSFVLRSGGDEGRSKAAAWLLHTARLVPPP